MLRIPAEARCFNTNCGKPVLRVIPGIFNGAFCRVSRGLPLSTRNLSRRYGGSIRSRRAGLRLSKTLGKLKNGLIEVIVRDAQDSLIGVTGTFVQFLERQAEL